MSVQGSESKRERQSERERKLSVNNATSVSSRSVVEQRKGGNYSGITVVSRNYLTVMAGIRLSHRIAHILHTHSPQTSYNRTRNKRG